MGRVSVGPSGRGGAVGPGAGAAAVGPWDSWAMGRGPMGPHIFFNAAAMNRAQEGHGVLNLGMLLEGLVFSLLLIGQLGRSGSMATLPQLCVLDAGLLKRPMGTVFGDALAMLYLSTG